MQNLYSTEDRFELIIKLTELIRDLTNWGKWDTDEEWFKKTKAFEQVTANIPTQHLELCVLQATRSHKNNKDFAAAEVAEAWNEVAEVLARDAVGGHSNRQEL